MSGYIDHRAAIGMPPEHRDYRWRYLDEPRPPGILTYFHPDIHPTAIVEAFASVDSGLTTATTIGRQAFVMKHAHVGHDAQVGAYVNLAPGCVLGGFVVVGDFTRIGIGAVVRPRVQIGERCVIGAGAVVVKDVPDGAVRVGNPACTIEELRARNATTLDYAAEWEEWYNDWHGST